MPRAVLEAIVRLSCIIALPTDFEIGETGVRDAGEYMMALLADSNAMQSFVATQKTGWQTEPKQRVSRCVAHVISIMVRTVEENLAMQQRKVNSDHKLSEQEVSGFEVMRRQGQCLSQMTGAAALLDGIRAAAEVVRGLRRGANPCHSHARKRYACDRAMCLRFPIVSRSTPGRI